MRRCAPFLVLLGLVVVLATAGVTAMSDTGYDADGLSTFVPAEPPAVTPPDPRVNEGRCGRVTYTPPGAGDRHRATLCRPTDTPRGMVVLVHGGGGYSGD